jgi:cell filamentation protein, protein adenylyltransferase
MPLKDYSTRDKYTYPNSPVLINIKNLKDGEKLEQFEANAVFLRSTQLILRPIVGSFDLKHLQAIHRYLFQDVYGWAGQLRTVNISKGQSTFGFAQYIEGHLTSELNKIARENMLVGVERPMFVVVQT